MNISKAEQRVLHVLAQGGMIRHRRNETGHIVEALCFTRDGHVLANTGLSLFTNAGGSGNTRETRLREGVAVLTDT